MDWDLYNRLSDAIGEGQHVRLADDGEDLEIMTAGYLHEHYKGSPKGGQEPKGPQRGQE